MKKDNLVTGKSGELLAAEYLQKLGCKIMALNYRNIYGEIDIIALDGKEIVFVEVKARKDLRFGLPQEAVTCFKQNKIRKTALYYLQSQNMLDKKCRFDVIGIVLSDKNEITHLISAFE